MMNIQEKTSYVAALMNSLPDDEVDEHVAKDERTEKFPAHSAHVFNAVRHSEHAPAKIIFDVSNNQMN